MAVRYPENCRNVTAGALRQIKQKGFTTGSGGFFSQQVLNGLVTTNHGTLLRHNEPTGKFMSALNEAKSDLEEMTEAIRTNTLKMVTAATEANETMLDASRKMRESADKLGAAMTKFSATFGNAKFAEQAQAATQMADALERLATLEEKGMLASVMTALGKYNA